MFADNIVRLLKAFALTTFELYRFPLKSLLWLPLTTRQFSVQHVNEGCRPQTSA